MVRRRETVKVPEPIKPHPTNRKPDAPKKSGNSKAVVRIARDGTEKRYKSIRKAAKENNTMEQGISHVLHGRTKTAGGYGWRYDKG